jgi:hypothetical protein
MPRSAITLASPVPYVFVTPRQWTAVFAFGPAASMAYSIGCSLALLEERMHLSEARLPVAVSNGRLGCLLLGLCGALGQSIVHSGFRKNNMQRREKTRA